jgi:hypothetical protein
MVVFFPAVIFTTETCSELKEEFYSKVIFNSKGNNMQKCINGWTKKKMLKAIKARRFQKASVDSNGRCVYLNRRGNRCAVGLFIPVGHEGEHCLGYVGDLLTEYPDLKEKMPLAYMGDLQRVHDGSALNAKTNMIEWVIKNVKD